MVFWNIDKPVGGTILAKLIGTWRPRYRALYYNPCKDEYYDENGDQVPRSAIKQWISIESEKEE